MEYLDSGNGDSHSNENENNENHPASAADGERIDYIIADM